MLMSRACVILALVVSVAGGWNWGFRSEFRAQEPKPDKSADPPKLRPPVNPAKAQSELIRVGMTEAKVLALLGTPDRYRIGNPTGKQEILFLIWEDANRIEIVFHDGDRKAIEISGAFCEHVKSKKITAANFKRLRLGMSRSEVSDILGPGLDRPAEKGTERWLWLNHRVTECGFQDGKIVAVRGHDEEDR
jgi:outer membrane protein assembly factor BamE (lipoprotein component of BamABCDE complex)